MLTIDKVYDAARVLESVVRHTQLIEAPRMSDEFGCKMYLKPESEPKPESKQLSVTLLPRSSSLIAQLDLHLLRYST